MTSERKRAGKTPSKADRELFRKAMSDGAPLHGPPPPTGDAPPRPAKPAAPAVVPRPRAIEKALPQLQTGLATGVDGRTAARLKRGQIRPEARLDLHGMTLDDAHRTVRSFIERCAGQGLRCVIVITGKGKLGEDAGTIRTEFPRWLNQGTTRARVSAFAAAQPRDGGGGASYVLLRRPAGRKG